MKKLMIAAAAVAMIGVAEAVTYVPGYDYTATVKTTKGKAGKGVTDTYQLGKGGPYGWWYEDPVATNLFAQLGQSTKPDDATVPCFIKDASKYLSYDGTKTNRVEGTAVTIDPTYTTVTDALGYLAEMYGEKSVGVYCETVKVQTKAVCYRVAGSRKFSTKLFTPGSCCSEAGYALTNSLASIEWDNPNSPTVYYFLQRFGSESKEKANKVEIFAYTQVPEWENFDGSIAGQGTWDINKGWLATISGNIVGKIDGPTCEACCKDGSPAIAFICDTWNKNDSVSTAAFGTFRIKYNAKCFK